MLDVWCHKYPRALRVQLCWKWARRRSYWHMPHGSFSHQFIIATTLTFQSICLASFPSIYPWITCLATSLSALPSHQKEENVTAILISPSHNLNRNRVSPSDSRSIAVRGAGVDHTARVHTGLPGCPTHSLYGKKGTLSADMEPILGLTAVSQGQSGHVFSTVKADPFRGVF